jgi:hypothetical protein
VSALLKESIHNAQSVEVLNWKKQNQQGTEIALYHVKYGLVVIIQRKHYRNKRYVLYS